MRIPVRVLSLSLVFFHASRVEAASEAVELRAMTVTPQQYREEVPVGPYGQP